MANFISQNLLNLNMRDTCLANLKKIKVKSIKKNQLPNRKGAVLVLLCVGNDSASLLFTMRFSEKNNNDMYNLLTYPGGKSINNETPEQTALRVAYEDIGLRPDKVEIWGCGPEFPGPNNNILITPVIAQIRNLSFTDDFKRNKNIIQMQLVSLDCFCDRKRQFLTPFKNGNVLPVFNVDGFKIEGLTAYITHAFLQSLLPCEIYSNDWITYQERIVLPQIYLKDALNVWSARLNQNQSTLICDDN